MKRFMDSERWFDPWYRHLPGQYKLLWEYIWSRCDNAGVWVVDLELAQSFTGSAYDKECVLTQFGDRVRDLGNGLWWVPGYIPFQFGKLTATAKVHQSVRALLQQHKIESLSNEIGISLQRDQEKDKYKEKEKESLEKGSGEKPLSESVSAAPKLPPDRRSTGTGSIPDNEAQALQWAGMDMVPPDFARDIFHQCVGRDWKDGANVPIACWRSYVKSRWSRQQKSEAQGKRNGKPLSVMDLNSAIKIKEEKARQIKDRYSTEGPVSTDWRDILKHGEYVKLCREIKGLKSRIEAMTA